MTPETAEHLARAREHLAKAHNLLDVMHYNDDAGRAAYLAGFHAAQALISERTGQIAKTHEGVNSQFNLLTRGDPRIGTELRRFLSKTYDLKAVADYEAGPGSVVPLERVKEALATATRFIDAVAALLA
ncbi:MAG TPA: HEPN domain-containing protein [Stellaceae bacterium]|nr:HEPN domain-containing protein [Stellaceae bacterium]